MWDDSSLWDVYVTENTRSREPLSIFVREPRVLVGEHAVLHISDAVRFSRERYSGPALL